MASRHPPLPGQQEEARVGSADGEDTPQDFATALRRGHQLYAAQDYVGAEAAFRLAFGLEPGSANVVLALGHTLVMLGRDAEASELAEEALRRHPAHARLLLLAAPLRLKLGNPAAAVAAYEEATPLITEEAVQRHAQQGLERARQALAAAAGPLRPSIRKNMPSAASPLSAARPGDSLLLGTREEAWEALAAEETAWLAHAMEPLRPLEEVSATAPARPGLLRRIGVGHPRGPAGMAADAATEAQRIFARGQPGDAEAAEALLLRSARRLSDDGPLLLRLGALLAWHGREEAGVNLLRRGAKLATQQQQQQQQAVTHLVLSSALARLGRRDEALVAICLADELLPEDPRIARHLGFHMLARGDHALAGDAFRKALAAQRDVALLPWLARALVALGRERQALEIAETMMAHAPRDARPLLLAGLLRLRLGDAEGAIGPLDASRNLPNGDAALVDAALAVARKSLPRPPEGGGNGSRAGG
jgi:tetratricopeptide (TPR) repeat protein